MYLNKSILAIITARGGSKGLPGKNIKIINGKPLIGWTLDQAKKSKYLDEIFVSTDDNEIAKVSGQFGVDVPNLRPAELAQDDTSSMDVLEHTIKYLESKNKKYDYFILLEPTSPLRMDEDIDSIIKLAVDNPQYDGVISVGEVHTEHPSIVKRINNSGQIEPYLTDNVKYYQRQQHDKAYFPYGVGYLLKVNVFMQAHTIYTENMMPYIIERWQNYEIDDIYDFVCIQEIMKIKDFI